MAAQCLLLSSKFIETARIYPAEVVYLIKGWGRQDFDALMSGDIEEYILNTIKFDLMMISPADFIDFYMLSWNQTLPTMNCQQVFLPECMKDMWSSEVDQKKFYLHVQSICDLMVSNLGPRISLLYLPSQVASAAIHIGFNSFFRAKSG